MAFCTKCGKENNDGASFCGACGNPLKPAAPKPTEPVYPDYTPNDDLDKTIAIGNNDSFDDYGKTTVLRAPENNNVDPDPNAYAGYDNYTPDGGYDESNNAPKKKKSKKKAIIISVIIALLLAGAAVLIYFLFFAAQSLPGCALYAKDGNLYYTSLSESITPVKIASGINTGNYDDVEPYITNDEDMIVYAADHNDGEYTLFFSKTENPSPVAISNNVEDHKLLPESKYVIYESEDSLYQYNLETRESLLIKNDAYLHVSSEDETRILYSTEEYNHYNSTHDYTYYVKELEGKETMIDSEVDRISYTSDLDKIFYVKDNILYSKDLSSAAKQIDSDVDHIFGSFESGEVYYSKNSEETYYYDGTSSHKIYDTSCDEENLATEAPVMVFTVDDSESVMIAAGKNTFTIPQDDVERTALNESGTKLYYIADTTRTMSYDEYSDTSSERFESGNLYYIEIDGEKIEAPVLYDKEVCTINFIDGEALLYAKNNIEINDVDMYDLYIDKNLIASQACPTTLYKDSAKFSYAKNPVSTDDGTTAEFYLYDGSESVKIGDGIANVCFAPNGDAMYIKNPRIENDVRCLDFYYFNDGKSVLIESAVETVYPDYDYNDF